MHTALRSYKDGPLEVQRYAMPRLAAILWRFLEQHEVCVARAAGVSEFGIVTTVPSRGSDEQRKNLQTIVKWCDPISDRYVPLLRTTGEAANQRAYDERRYAARQPVGGEQVLLIDDTWAGGGHAQSAAHALKSAGARSVGLVVIGRHVRPEWQVTDDKTCGDLLAELPRRFDWSRCTVH